MQGNQHENHQHREHDQAQNVIRQFLVQSFQFDPQRLACRTTLQFIEWGTANGQLFPALPKYQCEDEQQRQQAQY